MNLLAMEMIVECASKKGEKSMEAVDPSDDIQTLMPTQWKECNLLVKFEWNGTFACPPTFSETIHGMMKLQPKERWALGEESSSKAKAIEMMRPKIAAH